MSFQDLIFQSEEKVRGQDERRADETKRGEVMKFAML
jgi:hypothetical protein